MGEQAQRLIIQSDCTTQIVVSGDSCGSLASKCGISASEFTLYNPQPGLCSSLAPDQRVCCSPGSLPDIKPRPNNDGSCAIYIVQSNDTCSVVANKNGLTAKDLSTFNDKTTWGWSGCGNLQVNLAICLSVGKPPMPAPLDNAICGPLKSGTSPPEGSTKLADLNPCPLNACCNMWGQCGITPAYCAVETGLTGNPGTAPPGRNGCISNCGSDVVVHDESDQPQSTFRKVTYYESWNWGRPCLNMRAESIDITAYTHVHWSFATITSDNDVAIDDQYGQFPAFIALPDIKKIVSFGGWGYSTDTATYNAIRTAMSPSNAATFADKIVAFINKNGLDGVDFDWEYPGAPDIPNIPAGLASDTPNYLAFLRLLRTKMPEGKSISIAAPASYWYLKAFPIAEMAKVLDYIVYMTYDLHGQWDYGNIWSQDGCPAGNCLRSHVNLTETMYALAMITKAGVPASKINVGVSSYGRSFGMTQPGCIGPTCSFGGPSSTATPGQCTNEAGYISNAEIYDIININDTETETWHDTESDSNILVYGGDQWVAFMDEDTKTSRTNLYRNLNFGGIVDWAIDLQEFLGDDGSPDDDDDGDDLPDLPNLPPCDARYSTLEDLDASSSSFPSNCRAIYLVETLSTVLKTAVKSYHDLLQNGYDASFKTYSQAVAQSAGASVRDFVNQNGNKYFSCVVTEASVCCDYCKTGSASDNQCKYCFKDTCYRTCSSITGCTTSERLASERLIKKYAVNNQDRSSNSTIGQVESSQLFGQLAHAVDREGSAPQQVLIVKSINETEPCPPDYSQRGFGPDNPHIQSVYWTLNADKTDQFYKDLEDSTGIPKDKIQFVNYNDGADCGPHAKPDDDCWSTNMDFGMAQPVGYSASDITNPKNTVQKALDNSNTLLDQIAYVSTNLRNDGFDGNPFDLVDSISIPVLMITEAVDSMAQVQSAAGEMNAAKEKGIILAFIGAILFLIPVAGEIIGAVTEMADVSAILLTVGAVGNAAMDIYTIVDDPENAPLAIFDLVMAPLALLDVVGLAKAAKIRRGMSDDDIAKLGGKIGARMSAIKKVTGNCHAG